MRLRFPWLLALALLALLAGCRREKLEEAAIHGLVHDPYPVAPAHPAPSLRVLIWPDTLIPEVVQGFEERYGIKIETTEFHNDEDAYSRLVANPAGWDVVMTTQYMGNRMRRDGLLQRVPRLNPEIYRYVDRALLNPQGDPQMVYFLPFDFTGLGISFNVDYLPGFPRGWSYLSDHPDNPYLYGRVVMVDDMRYALGVAMLYAGRNPGNPQPGDLATARDILISTVRQVGLRFLSDAQIREEMISNKALMAITWSGEGAAILKEKPSCRFLLPEGPTIMTVDGFGIPRGSDRAETAALFIEYMLHPYTSYLVANACMYASVNQRAMRHVDRFIVNGPSAVMPPVRDITHMKNLDAAERQAYEAAWAAVKAVPFDPSRVNPLPLQ